MKRLFQSGVDYYPFGLTFNSFQRENSVDQRWKFQGQEHIDDLGLNWDSFKWRNHQPDIGRFFSIDPLSEEYYYNSPYAFSENKVTSHKELEGLESRRSISAEEINGQWTMGSDNNMSMEAEGKQKLEAMATKNRGGSSTSDVKALVGALEIASSISTIDNDPVEGSIVPALQPLSWKSKAWGGSLIGLSAINVALGAKDLRTQAKEKGWGNVNKLDAAQVTVGAFGTAASGLEWFGLGSASVTRIAASANLFGIVLSIPSSWYSIYDGAYKLSTMPPASTGDPEADQYLQLQYDKGIRTDDDYFQY